MIAATVLLPLAVMLLGLWERQRGPDDWAAFDAERTRLTQVVTDLEARAPRDGRMDFRMQFRRDGQTYVGPLALTEARAARHQTAFMASVMDWRRILPPIAVAAGCLAAALSGLVMLAGGLLGWAGQASREALVRGFSLVRRLLPPVLAAQILVGRRVRRHRDLRGGHADPSRARRRRDQAAHARRRRGPGHAVHRSQHRAWAAPRARRF